MENRFANFPTWLRVAPWVVVCWVVLFWKLGAPALMDPDEAHYAQLTREMLHARNWMIPLLDGLPYIDKPVLFHWLQGIAVAMLGETEAAMRLPSAVAAIALFLITQWTGAQLFDNRIGTRAWLMLATMPLTFMLGSIGVFDMVFTAFLFGAIAVALVAALRDRQRLQWVAYLLLSFAVMTKGPVALVLAGLFFVAGLACGREARAALLSLRWISGGILSVALSLPWFLWMSHALGWQFVHQYALAGNLYYITQPDSFSNRGFNHTLYVATFLAGFFPWSIVTLGGAVDALRRWRADLKVSTEEILLWTWVGVVFLFFSVARFKVDRYVYPAAPACCLLAARAWLSVNARRTDIASARDNVAARWSVAVLGVLLIVIGMYGGASLSDLGLELPRTALLLPISLAVAGAALTVGIVMRGGVSPALLTGIIGMLLVAYGSVIVIGVPILERARPTAAVAEALRPQLTADARVGLYRLEKWRFSLRYYLQRPVTRLHTPEDVHAFLKAGTPAYLLMLDEDFTRLRDGGIDLRCISERPAVTGTSGRGLRKQRWGAIIVASVGDPSGEH